MKRPYYTYQKAKAAVTIDPASLPVEKLVFHRVFLLDLLRLHEHTLYLIQLIDGGFMKSTLSSSSQGWSPKDIHLYNNLKYAFHKADNLYQRL